MICSIVVHHLAFSRLLCCHTMLTKADHTWRLTLAMYQAYLALSVYAGDICCGAVEIDELIPVSSSEIFRCFAFWAHSGHCIYALQSSTMVSGCKQLTQKHYAWLYEKIRCHAGRRNMIDCPRQPHEQWIVDTSHQKTSSRQPVIKR